MYALGTYKLHCEYKYLFALYIKTDLLLPQCSRSKSISFITSNTNLLSFLTLVTNITKFIQFISDIGSDYVSIKRIIFLTVLNYLTLSLLVHLHYTFVLVIIFSTQI